MLSWHKQKTRRVWATPRLAVKRFLRIDGTQWAAAFAFNAFFALFPLMILLVTSASFFIERDKAARSVNSYVEGFLPMNGEMQRNISETIAGVIEAREQAGVVAFLLLIWASLQVFVTLTSATNRAWNDDATNWWRLPVKSLVLLGITAGAVLLGIATLALARVAGKWLLPADPFHSWVYALGSFVLPVLIVFFTLSLFYKIAPRRPTTFAQVWVAALCATVLLKAGESLFVIYLKNFATLNAVYGALGGIMALLLWIYISGGIFIFGACLCAAQAEVRSSPTTAIIVE
ncbi:MAG: hypothetical protein A2289_10015 [Deltaproteobacteria bacterium RIFOXYA12_FULL_58_15]|nr:MAG: hypothetical protein A2289_10015 [Deltaproteobacteria bacterium RIFOXYA12_FULL_58_15]OGR07314.1 MAG: hypothetical protein A2341_03060 [Deltaproteobacteria bacterium RIFOXYB12_FULL_58_9]